MRTSLATLALVALLAACQSSPDPNMPDLAGTSWQLAAIEGSPALTDVDVSLKFTDDQLSGHTGINRYHGAWTWSGSLFDAGPFMTTRAAGPPEWMQQEQHMLRALEEADRLRLEGDRLTFGTAAGDSLVFVRGR